MIASRQVFPFLLFFCLIIKPNDSSVSSLSSLAEARRLHIPKILGHEKLVRVSDVLNDISILNATLKNIMVRRVVGTEAHIRVGNYIMQIMKNLNWDVEVDSFKSPTPLGELQFRNIVASHNRNAKRFLTLACHYDSKFYPEEHNFVGATDSAVPCAMIIQIAHSLQEALNRAKNNHLSLRLIFFDGEEAFQTWSDSDSLYGARHLANKWRKEPFPEGGPTANQLDRIDMLVLLDLLGAKSPQFYSFYPRTHKYYAMLANAETKLHEGNLLRDYRRRYFLRKSTDMYIEDDHLPFFQNNVPILHLITVPFPAEWHTPGDNHKIIDMPTTQNLVKILTVFVTEYMRLDV